VRGPVILMYHAFGEPASRFVCPPSRLAAQLRWLARRRRPVLPLAELAEHRQAHTLPPAGSVVVTIDDGYTDTAAVAAPVLRQHGVPATVFVISGLVESAEARPGGPPDLARRPLMSAEQLRALPADKIEVGAHTRTHPLLPELSAEALDGEVAGSRADLAGLLGAPPAAFAYPHGRTSPDAVAAVERAGFTAACGIERGLNDPGTPLLELRRTPVDGDDSLLRFVLAVWSGDPDLLRRPFQWLRARRAG